jgi:hypothetical protein
VEKIPAWIKWATQVRYFVTFCVTMHLRNCALLLYGDH